VATPNWSAARAGLLGDNGAVDASAQINQFLGMHAGSEVYQGNAILTPNGLGGTDWTYHLDAYDLAQPFTMSGTAIGRVVLPLLPSGTGADLIVSLYTNNAGVPGTLVTQTRVPASWLVQQAALTAVAGPSNTAPVVQDTGNALAGAGNCAFHIGAWTSVGWSFPSVSATSLLFPNTNVVLSGNYMVSVGGTTFTGPPVGNVFSYFYDGATLGTAVAQPSLPQGLSSAAAAATSDTIICMGGVNSVDQATVYTASWDGAGTVGAWAQQTSLPQAIESTTSGAATWNDSYVYLVGGSSGGTTLSTVYWAQTQNGQITSWNSGPPLPIAVTFPSVAVIGNFLVVTGGQNATVTVSASTYYAPINTNGSLGAWQAGPSSPVATSGGIVAADSGLFIVGGWTVPSFSPTNDLQSLSFDSSGPGSWFRGTYNGTLPDQSLVQSMFAIFSSGTDTWQVFDLNPTSYLTATLTRIPVISVPLPATGLTNATTYHIVLSQPGSDLNNYAWLSDDVDVFPGNPTVLTRATGSTSWSAGASGHAVPLTIYDNSNGTGTPGARNNRVVHTWQDSGARVSTLITTNTPDRRLVGVLDATVQPGPVLNPNFDFSGGVDFWNAGNGTLVQSSAFTQGGLPFSGKFTPNGVSASVDIESQLQAVNLQQSYTGTCWFYSPTGYSNCEIIVNWYTAAGFSGGFISSATGATTSVAANTWTRLAVTGTPPSTAVYATVGVYQRGTPPATAIFYASAVTLQAAPGPQVSSVAQIDYSGTWPGVGLWPATGVTVLA